MLKSDMNGRCSVARMPSSRTRCWLDRAGQSRFFLWAHLYDPHRPYDPAGTVPVAVRQSVRRRNRIRGCADRPVARLSPAPRAARQDRRGGSRRSRRVARRARRAGPRHLRLRERFACPLDRPRAGQAHARVGSVVRLDDVMPTVLDSHGIAAPSVDGISLRHSSPARQRDLDLEAYSDRSTPCGFGWSPLRALRDAATS